jgi:hypothetical protein
MDYVLSIFRCDASVGGVAWQVMIWRLEQRILRAIFTA